MQFLTRSNSYSTASCGGKGTKSDEAFSTIRAQISIGKL